MVVPWVVPEISTVWWTKFRSFITGIPMFFIALQPLCVHQFCNVFAVNLDWKAADVNWSASAYLSCWRYSKNNDVRSVKETRFFSTDCSSRVSAWIAVVSGKDEMPKEKSRVKESTDFCIFFFFIHVLTSNMWWEKTGMIN